MNTIDFKPKHCTRLDHMSSSL
jgi:hypothetical protein